MLCVWQDMNWAVPGRDHIYHPYFSEDQMTYGSTSLLLAPSLSIHNIQANERDGWFHGNGETTELLIRLYFLYSCRNRRKLGERSFKRGDKNLSEDLVITKWNVIFLGNESSRESFKDRLLLKSLLFSLVVSHVCQFSYLEVKGSLATCLVFLLQPLQHLIMGLE